MVQFELLAETIGVMSNLHSVGLGPQRDGHSTLSTTSGKDLLEMITAFMIIRIKNMSSTCISVHGMSSLMEAFNIPIIVNP